MNKKGLALLLALMLVIGAAVGGTVAWLTAKTDAVVNTFTTSDISIKLEETTTDYKMVPGYAISKDPKVTVLAGSEKCYLFVKLEKSANFDDFLKFTMADGWTQGDGTNIPENVYYREVEAVTAVTSYYVLQGSTEYPNGVVTVSEELTKAEVNSITAENQPKLTFTAYAVQKDGIADAGTAWAKAVPTTNP